LKKLKRNRKIQHYYQIKICKVQKEMRKEYLHVYGQKAPLHFAVAMNDIKKLKQLLLSMCPNDYHPSTGETPLHLACRLGKLNLVKELLQHTEIRADLLTLAGPKSVSVVGSTAADIASTYKESEIWSLLTKLERGNKDQDTFVFSLPDNYWALTELVKKVNLERQSLAALIGEKDWMLQAELDSMQRRIMAVYRDCNDLKPTCGVKGLEQRQADEVKLEAALTKCRDIQREQVAFQQRVAC